MGLMRCTGIAAVIDRNPNAKLRKDKRGRYYEITQKMAEKFVADGAGIPLRIEHDDRIRIGKVTGFEIRDVAVNKNTDKRPVLLSRYEIDSDTFIESLRQATANRYTDVAPMNFISSDKFLEPFVYDRTDPNTVDVDAKMALSHKLPGLSLGHSQSSPNILEEMSLCMAGARDLTVVTEVEYLGHDANREMDDNGYTVSNYDRKFAACHSMGNSHRIRKVVADLNALDMPNTCTLYTFRDDDKNTGESTASFYCCKCGELVTAESTANSDDGDVPHSVGNTLPLNAEVKADDTLHFNRPVGNSESQPVSTDKTAAAPAPVLSAPDMASSSNDPATTALSTVPGGMGVLFEQMMRQAAATAVQPTPPPPLPTITHQPPTGQPPVSWPLGWGTPPPLVNFQPYNPYASATPPPPQQAKRKNRRDEYSSDEEDDYNYNRRSRSKRARRDERRYDDDERRTYHNDVDMRPGREQQQHQQQQPQQHAALPAAPSTVAPPPQFDFNQLIEKKTADTDTRLKQMHDETMNLFKTIQEQQQVQQASVLELTKHTAAALAARPAPPVETPAVEQDKEPAAPTETAAPPDNKYSLQRETTAGTSAPPASARPSDILRTRMETRRMAMLGMQQE